MIRQDSAETWRDAANIIRSGGLVVFPTDTVYGIGCDPYDVTAIEGVFNAKSRSHLKALPLLLSSVAAVSTIAADPGKIAAALGKAFWPGALTIVLKKKAALPDELGGVDTIAVRVPDHDGLRGMIELCGGAIAATSANISGLPDAKNAEEAAAYLENMVQLIVDGGQARGGVPSTVVNCAVTPPVILRQGAISEAEIMRVISEARAE